jgi:(S)-ureidoglycine aminohydrolase
VTEPFPPGVLSSGGWAAARYLVLTPGNYYPGRLPEFGDSEVETLVSPRWAPSQFGAYIVELQSELLHTVTKPEFEHFVFVLHGSVAVSLENRSEDPLLLGERCYAFVPWQRSFTLQSPDSARLLLVRRRYNPTEASSSPEPVFGDERSGHVAETGPLVTRRDLLPINDPAYDFQMSLLAFEPGVIFKKVEIHDEEHGLLMTRGRGLYYLDGDFREVRERDFIYMAPYCPQYFYPMGDQVAEYLLYKDAWRDGF